MPHIYLLTETRFVNPSNPDWYVQQILDEDELLSTALSAHGISTSRVNWSDPEVDWSAADAAIFRTTWDYFDRYAEFKSWYDGVKKHVRLINNPELIDWNIDKHYLLDLEKAGVPIVPSIFMERGSNHSLKFYCEKSGWDELILKPCVSGSARHTYRLNKDSIEAHEAVFKELVAGEHMMLQEFHTTIQSRGEVSHMVMGGRYTHSVLKCVKGTDFRVQDDFGGTVHNYEASPDERKAAEAAFAACKTLPAYGRVDIMWNEEGEPMVSELEIIEPELWFRNHPPAAQELAGYLAQIL